MGKRTAPLKLTERELWLLKCGFDSSFVDDGSDDGGAELAAISEKIMAAWMRAKGGRANAD